MTLVNKNETSLFIVNLIISLTVWIGLTVFTRGLILIIFFLGWVLSLLVQSLLVAHIKGDGVKITEHQFPDLYNALKFCCEKLSIEMPHAYIMNGHGILNAFATRFLMSNYLILHSDIVDPLEDNPKAIHFYIGHELGHIKRRHVTKSFLLSPANLLPILGQAYSRACEYTCDLHGLSCADSLLEAQTALGVLASGRKRWQTMNMTAFMDQSQQSGKFWMSFNELTRSHPWLSKRCIYLSAIANNTKPKFPRKNILSYLLALCIPNVTRNNLLNLLLAFYIICVTAALLHAPQAAEAVKHLNQQSANLLQENF